jgi:hypothetical protein
MSEEIKEFAPLVEETPVAQEEGPKFDPTKKYTWGSDAAIVISGAEFGLILNALRNVTTTPEAQALFLAAEAADKIEGVLARNVTNGNIVEAPEAPKGSL